jgi:hypothetical protein
VVSSVAFGLRSDLRVHVEGQLGHVRMLVQDLHVCQSPWGTGIEAPTPNRGAWPMTWRLRGARLWAGMAWGARRMQKVLDGDPTHAISLEGSLADHSQPGRGEGAREPRELDG